MCVCILSEAMVIICGDIVIIEWRLGRIGVCVCAVYILRCVACGWSSASAPPSGPWLRLITNNNQNHNNNNNNNNGSNNSRNIINIVADKWGQH